MHSLALLGNSSGVHNEIQIDASDYNNFFWHDQRLNKGATAIAVSPQ